MTKKRVGETRPKRESERSGGGEMRASEGGRKREREWVVKKR